jgi:hypothetical protein
MSERSRRSVGDGQGWTLPEAFLFVCFVRNSDGLVPAQTGLGAIGRPPLTDKSPSADLPHAARSLAKPGR